MSDHTDGLRRELAYYEAQGKDDRAALVRVELAKSEKADAAEARKADAEENAADVEKDAEAKAAKRSLRGRAATEKAVTPPAEVAVEPVDEAAPAAEVPAPDADAGK